MNIEPVGQIEPNKYGISKHISSLASKEDVFNIVEIGTWNGLGSTKCVLEGLRYKQNYMFKSYECWTEMYQQAIKNNKGNLSERFSIILGKTINENEISDWFNINDLNEQQKQWLQQDIDRMSSVTNVFSTIPDKIDLLILDGGEFSTYKEWLLLKNRVKYIVIDDTLTLKSKKIREEILVDSAIDIIADCLTERNGYLVCKINSGNITNENKNR